MAALVGNLTSVWNPVDLTLHFARQPEPDLEFTDEELDQTVATKGRSPLNPRKKSGGGRPVLWLLLLALVGGIAYVAIIEPEMLEEWLSPYLGQSTPAPVALKPKPVPKPPAAQPTPAPESIQSPSNSASAPSSPTDSPTLAAPAVVPPSQLAAKPAPPTIPPLDPMFSEGQKVTVTGDQAAPGGTIPLFADPSGIKPGPLVRLGVSLTVMDGDLQPNGWMYLVRTDDGAKGWVSEKRLRLKF
ncbi:MAG: hypothetical protein HOP32_17630 [Nitrospira sp.]|nr:hypothetical protein [Nitrospira sp.]